MMIHASPLRPYCSTLLAALLGSLLGGVALTDTLAAQAFTISQPSGNDTFGARSTGQTFTPGMGVVPNPSGQGVLLLTEIDLYHGNFASANPSATTWLKIYDADPQNGGNLIAISTNSVDTTNLTFRTLMTWTFPQIPLLLTTEYWAVMTTTATMNSVDPAEVSLETANRTIPSPNAYAGGAGLIANIAKHPNDVDARFEARFFNGVLGTFTVSGSGCNSSVGLPTLTAANPPRIGTSFVIDFGNLAGNLQYVVLGLSDQNWGPTPLPVSLASLLPGADPSCLVQVSVDAVAPLPTGVPTAQFIFPIPNDTGFVGVRIFVQAAQIQPTGFSVSEKGTITIGN
ncbi:MAG: hypothetical protein NXI31_11050 [bacterium]|nr:hypothetical protein [bacterium]